MELNSTASSTRGDLGSGDVVRGFVPDLAAIANLGPVGPVVTGT